MLRRTESIAFVTLAAGIACSSCSDGNVRFGPPDNLRVRQKGGDVTAACPLPPTTKGMACPSWENDIFAAMFDKPQSETHGLGCTNGSCHLATATSKPASPPALYAKDPQKSYESLKAYVNTDINRPYLSDAPSAEHPPYMLCNLEGGDALLGQQKMPIGKTISDADLAIIGAWVCCGTKEKGGGVTCGGAGAGGAGGGKM